MSAVQGVTIRPETAADRSHIRRVNESAFPTPEEADLVDALRSDGLVLLSAVAEMGTQVVGHILFSRMSIDTRDTVVAAAALAPMAVMPPYQRRGIGGRLIGFGLDELRRAGERIVIVVGHPGYYPRFGFSSAQARSLESPFPADAFMALALTPGALDGVHGRVRYPPAFGI